MAEYVVRSVRLRSGREVYHLCVRDAGRLVYNVRFTDRAAALAKAACICLPGDVPTVSYFGEYRPATNLAYLV